MPDLNVITEWLPMALLVLAGFAAVVADIVSADRALYFSTQQGDEA